MPFSARQSYLPLRVSTTVPRDLPHRPAHSSRSLVPLEPAPRAERVCPWGLTWDTAGSPRLWARASSLQSAPHPPWGRLLPGATRRVCRTRALLSQAGKPRPEAGWDLSAPSLRDEQTAGREVKVAEGAEAAPQSHGVSYRNPPANASCLATAVILIL